jgi:hypothetical protein
MIGGAEKTGPDAKKCSGTYYTPQQSEESAVSLSNSLRQGLQSVTHRPKAGQLPLNVFNSPLKLNGKPLQYDPGPLKGDHWPWKNKKPSLRVNRT